MRGLILVTVALMLGCTHQNNNSSASQALQTDTCKITFLVEGMTCTGCEKTIESKIATLDLVKSVKASHTDKTATVVFSTLTPDTTLIKNTIAEVGYKVTGINSLVE